MAAGGWIGGLLYDHFGYYAPAFATGVAVSAVNFMIITVLALRRSQTSQTAPA
jgi:predicted MFS family arabinose efflux permease